MADLDQEEEEDESEGELLIPEEDVPGFFCCCSTFTLDLGL